MLDGERALLILRVVTFPLQSPESVLFITLDSCRFDTFADADLPNIKAIGPLHRAQAPCHFTYGSHMAMFVGFTPGDCTRMEPFVNPKFGKIFRMMGNADHSHGEDYFRLPGRNIIDGFKRIGYRTLGTGAMGWFNTDKETSRYLTCDFDEFFFSARFNGLNKQLDWVAEKMAALEAGKPLFLFMNIGETHVPYHYPDAPWERVNPCVPFRESGNDAGECRRRQTGCAEYIDGLIGDLLTAFANANTLICADHGDAWGEDGLWGHCISHPKVLEVPLLFRLQPKVHQG
jgi:hypothetical protein